MMTPFNLDVLEVWAKAIKQTDLANRAAAGQAMLDLVAEVRSLLALRLELRGWRQAWRVLTAGLVVEVGPRGELVCAPAPSEPR